MGAFLRSLDISLVPFLLLVALALFLWLTITKTNLCMAIFLFIMPLFTLAFLIAKFFGPSYIAGLEGLDRAILCLLALFLLIRNGIRLVFVDCIALGCLLMALLRLPLDGLLLSLASDFGFLIAYFAGRTMMLPEEQQGRWARVAVWVVAIISVASLCEVFGLGEGPRTILYMKTAEATIDNGVALNASFHSSAYTGLRASGTMLGPLQFGPLCMIALIFWWVYSGKAIPGLMILAGLLCSLTRSAWVGTFVAILALGLLMGRAKRLALYGGLALTLILVAAPFIGLENYFSAKTQKNDISAEQHKDSVQEGLLFLAQHPLGAGSKNVGRQALKTDDKAVYFENAYLSLAGAYGIPTVFCLLVFIFVLMMMGLKSPNKKLGYTVFGILLGFTIELLFASLHDVFPLACWIWFPAGLMVSQSAARAQQINEGQQKIF